jgi:hypothetical protein
LHHFLTPFLTVVYFSQAKQKELEAVEHNIRETEAKIKEIVTQFNSDLLSENPEVAFQVTGTKTKYAWLAFCMQASLTTPFLWQGPCRPLQGHEQRPDCCSAHRAGHPGTGPCCMGSTYPATCIVFQQRAISASKREEEMTARQRADRELIAQTKRTLLAERQVPFVCVRAFCRLSHRCRLWQAERDRKEYARQLREENAQLGTMQAVCGITHHSSTPFVIAGIAVCRPYAR